MEEEHILSADQLESEEAPSQNNDSGVNKVLLGIVVVLLLLITGGGAYFLGTRKTSTNNELQPTQPPLDSATLGEESQNEEDMQISATDSATITPSVTSEVTPSVTPIETVSPTFKINPNLKIELPTSTPINP